MPGTTGGTSVDDAGIPRLDPEAVRDYFDLSLLGVKDLLLDLIEFDSNRYFNQVSIKC